LCGVQVPADESILPAALIFDLDGAMVDTETVEYEAIRTVWAQHGVEYSATRYAEVVGTIVGAAWLDELEAAIGSTVDRAASRAMHRDTHRRLTDALQPRDGIIALIEAAAAAGVPMAIASNAPRWWVDARVEALELGESLPVLVTLDESSAPKPDPAPFAEACAALGVEPSRSVAFEDSSTGVRSALAAGLYTVACAGPLSVGHDLSDADRVITSHTEVTLAELGRAVAERARSQGARRLDPLR
jgi:HAD superfamily hydrolase (TIGR01509 family)